jgi:hypothetical protein
MSENQSENVIAQALINKICTRCNKSNKTFSINKRKQLNISCDDCNLKRKEYRDKNKEQISEKSKEYRVKNKDKLNEYQKEYYVKNKDKQSEYKKEYNAKNKEKISEKRKEYYAKNKEKISERNKEYRVKNKDKNKDNHEYQHKQYIKQQEYIEKNKEKIDEYKKEYRSRPIHRIKQHLYNRVTSLKSVKPADIKSHLGCDLNEYITYLQSKFKDGMTLENYNTVWYIKYISNHYWARTDTIEEKMAILHYTNTEPTYSSKYSQNNNEEIIIEIVVNIIDMDITNIEGRYIIKVIEGNIKKPGQRFVISNPDKIIIKIIDIFNIEGHYVIRCIKGNIKQGQRFVLSYY